MTVLDDFAHHPTAVQETLSALRMGYPGRRIWAVFEPRSASSCRRVFQDAFAEAFGGADEVVVAPRVPLVAAGARAPVGRAADRRSRRPGGAAPARCRRWPPSCETVSTEAAAGDLVVVMSNGGFGGIHGKLLHGAVGVTFPRLRDAGDSMLLFELEPVVDAAVNARAVATAAARARQRTPGRARRARHLSQRRRGLRPAARRSRRDCTRAGVRATRPAARRPPGRDVEIPVVYGGADGPDLAEVADRSGLSAAAAGGAHTRADVSRVHARLHAGLRLPGTGRRGDCGPAARHAAAAGGGRVGGDRRPADRHLSARLSRRLGDCRTHRHACCSTRHGRRPRCVQPGDRVRFVPVRSSGRRCRPLPRRRASGRRRAQRHRDPAGAADDGAGRGAMGPPGAGRAGGRRARRARAARRPTRRSATTPAPRCSK